MSEAGSDARFGTKGAKRIGDSWLMQTDNAYLDDALHPNKDCCLAKAAKREKGTVRLTRRVRRNGVECLQIDTEQSCKNGLSLREDLDSQEEGLDTQVEIVRSLVQRKVSAMFPIDTSMACLRCTDTRRWMLVAEASEGELRGWQTRMDIVATSHKTAKLKARVGSQPAGPTRRISDVRRLPR